MRRLLNIASLVLATGLLVAADGTAGDYRLSAPITIKPGATVQRIEIQAAVLAASQTADLSDLRVFDATNRAMPISRIAPALGPYRRYELPVLPIMGAADALTVTGVSLRLDGNGQARVAQVVGTPSGGSPTPTLLGALLDLRTIAGRSDRLTFDADVPPAQPVTFVVEASSDLKNWQPLGEQVAYRAGNATKAVTFKLGGVALQGDYVRITWHAASRLLSPVKLRSAALMAGGDAGAGETIAAVPPPLTNDHILEFELPFASPLASMQLIATGNDMIVPVRVLGRDNREQPWARLGEGVAARPSDSPRSRGTIAIDGSTFRTIRIEADARSAGFSSPPLIRLGFQPRAIAFLAGGRQPFTLAVGRPETPDTYLPLANLTDEPAHALPTALVKTADTPLRLEQVNDAGSEKRQMFLWAILVAATLLLAGMAWTLWRHNKPAKSGPG